jgi:hypothetical protein
MLALRAQGMGSSRRVCLRWLAVLTLDGVFAVLVVLMSAIRPAQKGLGSVDGCPGLLMLVCDAPTEACRDLRFDLPIRNDRTSMVIHVAIETVLFTEISEYLQNIPCR